MTKKADFTPKPNRRADSLNSPKELEKQLAPTVHEGDCTYEGDIRTLVGVARWKKEGMDDLSQDYFVEYLRSDLLVTGSSVCQNVSK
jgi:hypothetical protein